MANLIIGTAGHVDHGKTALIQALNGFEGDETNEEKRRGITINLSFSHLSRNEDNIAFIDVPGHENLIKTMISGAFGFDACMLIIAANEGIKPQTMEHAQILNALGIKSAILVITKCDLVSENQATTTLNEVKKYLSEFTQITPLESFLVSAKTGVGIQDLTNYLFTLKPCKRGENNVFRYYIDRIFGIKGRGVVVTGSVLSGAVKCGEKLYNVDLGEIFGVKGLQIHGNDVESATAPARVAINLQGNCEKLKIGQILSKKGFWRGFKEIDCEIKFFGDRVNSDISSRTNFSVNSQLNSQNSSRNVVFCVGSKQVNAKITRLEGDFFSAKFDKEMFLAFGEKFILLENGRASGGGEVLNPIGEPMKKAQKIELLKILSKRDFIGAFALLATFHKHGFGLISSYQRFGLNAQDAMEIASGLNGVFLDKNAACIYTQTARNDVKNAVLNLINKNKNAIFSANSLNLKLSWASANLIELALDELASEKIVQKNGNIYVKFGTNLVELEKSLKDKIYEIIKNKGIAPDAPYNIYDDLDIDRDIGDSALRELCTSKKIIRLEHNLYIESSALNLAVNSLRKIITERGHANVQNVKAELNISRKFALAYLEYLDKFDDIKREGDDRFFIKNESI